MSDHSKKTVIITGGSRGIGRSVCLSFAGAGTNIYFNYFSPVNPAAEEALAVETEKLISDAGGFAKGISVNVASENEVSSFLSKL